MNAEAMAVIDKIANYVRSLAELYLYDGDTDQPVNDGYGAFICFADSLPAGLAAPVGETRVEAVMALVDDIEDEYASACCNRGPRQPCTDECRRITVALDSIRAALSAPQLPAVEPATGCACGVATEHGPHESDPALPVEEPSNG